MHTLTIIRATQDQPPHEDEPWRPGRVETWLLARARWTIRITDPIREWAAWRHWNSRGAIRRRLTRLEMQSTRHEDRINAVFDAMRLACEYAGIEARPRGHLRLVADNTRPPGS